MNPVPSLESAHALNPPIYHAPTVNPLNPVAGAAASDISFSLGRDENLQLGGITSEINSVQMNSNVAPPKAPPRNRRNSSTAAVPPKPMPRTHATIAEVTVNRNYTHASPNASLPEALTEAMSTVLGE